MARAICFLFAGLIAASTAAWGESRLQVRSVVRADARTGKLVRASLVRRTPSPAPALPARIAPAPSLASAAPVTSPVTAPVTSPVTTPVTDLTAILRQASETHGVDPALVHSVVAVESGFNPLAVSPKGAQGLMQLMPGTARRFGVTDSFDVRQNIEAGVKYLRHLQEMFKDDRLALAAYNAGEGAVMRYGGIPPYRETEQYVEKVGRRLDSVRRTAPAAKPVQAQSESVESAKAPAEPAREPLRAVEMYTDDSGRIHLLTKDLVPRPGASSQ
jgi:soluble lytic murein transglycosylase-like protein